MPHEGRWQLQMPPLAMRSSNKGGINQTSGPRRPGAGTARTRIARRYGRFWERFIFGKYALNLCRTAFCSILEYHIYDNQDDNSAYLLLRTCSSVNLLNADLYNIS